MCPGQTETKNPERMPVYIDPIEISLPMLERAPVIDADLSEWKDYAYHGIIKTVRSGSWKRRAIQIPNHSNRAIMLSVLF